jgi:hypothetical protein
MDVDVNPCRTVIVLCPVAILSYLFMGTEYTVSTFLNMKKSSFADDLGNSSSGHFNFPLFYQWIYSRIKVCQSFLQAFGILVSADQLCPLYMRIQARPDLIAAHSLSLFII